MLYELGFRGEGAARKVQMLICVTMYNENEVLLRRTLDGIYENLENFSEEVREKVVVVVVQDGLLKMFLNAGKRRTTSCTKLVNYFQ
jgi:hypothetical protein